MPAPRSHRSPRTLWYAASALGLVSVVLLSLYLLVVRGTEEHVSEPEPTRHELHRETVAPGPDLHIVKVAGGPTIGIPPGALDAPAELIVAAVENAPALALPFPHVPLGAWDVKLGDKRAFREALLIALPFSVDQIPKGLAPEFALTASYWDEALGAWLEMPSVVDADTGLHLVPTRHLTMIRHDAVVAEGHVYNDFFSIKYDPSEQAAMAKKPKRR